MLGGLATPAFAAAPLALRPPAWFGDPLSGISIWCLWPATPTAWRSFSPVVAEPRHRCRESCLRRRYAADRSGPAVAARCPRRPVVLRPYGPASDADRGRCAAACLVRRLPRPCHRRFRSRRATGLAAMLQAARWPAGAGVRRPPGWPPRPSRCRSGCGIFPRRMTGHRLAVRRTRSNISRCSGLRRLFWHVILTSRRRGISPGLTAVVVSLVSLQGALLSAIIMFAPSHSVRVTPAIRSTIRCSPVC